MAVLERPSKQKIITSTLLSMLVIATIVFAALLIAKATELSNTPGIAKAYFGPVTLFEITKNSQTGYFTFVKSGMAIFTIFWFTVAVLVIAFRNRD